MYDGITQHHSEILDEVLAARRTVRAFKSDPPAREHVEAIIQAGLIAPFAALAVAGKPDFRKVIVIPRSAEESAVAAELLRARLGRLAGMLEKSGAGGPFLENLRRAAEHGLPGVARAPYLIVVAERKGMPPVASQSLSYCLHTMWLKAASLRIGFQLVSALAAMGDDSDFCRLIGIPDREFALDGCVIGYPLPDYEPPPVKYPDPETTVRWI